MHLARLIPALICLLLLTQAAIADVSDDEIRRILIQRSLASYPGNCPCPHNVDRVGRRCGARSAYSKQGGYGPLCFPSDVTDEMIKKYRQVSATH